MIWQLAFRRIARIWKRWRTMGCSRLVGKCCQPLLPGAELRGSRGAIAPPPKFCLARQKFFSLLLKVLHRPLTAPLVAKLAPPVVPPNENVCLRPRLLLFHVSRYHSALVSWMPRHSCDCRIKKKKKKKWIVVDLDALFVSESLLWKLKCFLTINTAKNTSFLTRQ